MSVTATRPSHVKATAIGGAVVGGLGGLLGSMMSKAPMGTAVLSTALGSGVGAVYYGGIGYLSYHEGINPAYLGAGAAGLAGIPVLLVHPKGQSKGKTAGRAVVAAGVAGGVGTAVAYWNRPDSTFKATPVPVVSSTTSSADTLPIAVAAGDVQRVIPTRRESVPGVFG